MTTKEPENAGYAAQVSARWALGDYDKISDIWAGLGRDLVKACGVRAGQRVLDVGAGTGNAAIPAAQAGAHVVASDIAINLIEVGETKTRRLDLDVRWCGADAQALPFVDGSFDVVLSCIGAMFAPDQEAAARELVRVCRAGGLIGMANWTPDGEGGRVSRLLASYLPQPSPRPSHPPLAWGDPARVQELLAGKVSSLETQTQKVRLDFSGTPREKLDYFRKYHPPVIAAYAAHDGDVETLAALDNDLLRQFINENGGRAEGPGEYIYEYLLVLARK